MFKDSVGNFLFYLSEDYNVNVIPIPYFSCLIGAQTALIGLNNRWFGGRCIRAELTKETPFAY